ncbi:hypothetical protein DFH09DRAFT_1370196 [Mycena vulgaris]|nr:hypothetical protein DFH09DRAFT_1370196 [Mycena vulgaris]
MSSLIADWRRGVCPAQRRPTAFSFSSPRPPSRLTADWRRAVCPTPRLLVTAFGPRPPSSSAHQTSPTIPVSNTSTTMPPLLPEDVVAGEPVLLLEPVSAAPSMVGAFKPDERAITSPVTTLQAEEPLADTASWGAWDISAWSEYATAILFVFIICVFLASRDWRSTGKAQSVAEIPRLVVVINREELETGERLAQLVLSIRAPFEQQAVPPPVAQQAVPPVAPPPEGRAPPPALADVPQPHVVNGVATAVSDRAPADPVQYTVPAAGSSHAWTSSVRTPPPPPAVPDVPIVIDAAFAPDAPKHAPAQPAVPGAGTPGQGHHTDALIQQGASSDEVTAGMSRRVEVEDGTPAPATGKSPAADEPLREVRRHTPAVTVSAARPPVASATSRASGPVAVGSGRARSVTPRPSVQIPPQSRPAVGAPRVVSALQPPPSAVRSIPQRAAPTSTSERSTTTSITTARFRTATVAAAVPVPAPVRPAPTPSQPAPVAAHPAPRALPSTAPSRPSRARVDGTPTDELPQLPTGTARRSGSPNVPSAPKRLASAASGARARPAGQVLVGSSPLSRPVAVATGRKELVATPAPPPAAPAVPSEEPAASPRSSPLVAATSVFSLSELGAPAAHPQPDRLFRLAEGYDHVQLTDHRRHASAPGRASAAVTTGAVRNRRIPAPDVTRDLFASVAPEQLEGRQESLERQLAFCSSNEERRDSEVRRARCFTAERIVLGRSIANGTEAASGGVHGEWEEGDGDGDGDENRAPLSAKALGKMRARE